MAAAGTIKLWTLKGVQAFDTFPTLALTAGSAGFLGMQSYPHGTLGRVEVFHRPG